MRRINHYGSIRLVVSSNDKQAFEREILELKQHSNAVFVEIPSSIVYASLFGILARNNFVVYVYRDDAVVFVGANRQLVPPAMNAHIGVAAVVFAISECKLLLIKEQRYCINLNTKRLEMFVVWKPVIGNVDKGELPQTTVLRKLREEIGIDVKSDVVLLDEKSSLTPNHVLDTCLYYAVPVANTIPPETFVLQASEGIVDAQWFDVYNLPSGVSEMTARIAMRAHERFWSCK